MLAWEIFGQQVRSGQDCNTCDDDYSDEDEDDDVGDYDVDDDYGDGDDDDVVPFAVGIRQCCSFWHR